MHDSYRLKDGLGIELQLAMAIWYHRERWHHFPYATHFAILRVRHRYWRHA